MKKAILILVTALSTAFAAPQTHDGFFLAMGLGFGGMSFTEDYGSYTVESDGGIAADFDFKIGGCLANNLAMHFSMTSISLGGYDLIEDGENIGSPDYSLGISFMGIGMTYYFMPYNIFLSGSVGISQFTISDLDSDASVSSDNGFGFHIAAGKEWWVSENWGLGISLGITHASVNQNNSEYDDYDIDIKGTAFAVMFSATFN
jgi:hypothetical protein